MIAFENVEKFYINKQGRRWILKGANFEIPRGSSLGVLGRNGAGKSTLLRMLCGMETPNRGRIVRNAKLSWPLGLGGLQPALTGEENVRFVSRIYGADWRDTMDFVKDFSELDHELKMPVRTFSSGMKARFQFAVSMAIQFECYLIDESTAVGDKRFQEKCRRAFAARRDRADVIMVSHHGRTIRDYCQYAAVLNEGRLQFYEDLDEAFAAYNALEAKAAKA